MKRVCVFCGSSAGGAPDYEIAAITLGSALARQRITLVYGGAHVGLMGTLANAALANGGEVVTIPFLNGYSTTQLINNIVKE